MSSTTSRESKPFNEAIIQSWTNQTKIYEDEIKMKEEVTRYREMMDNLQQKQLEGSLYKKGRNSLNKSGFDKFNHSNSKIILTFCKNRLFPTYKFIEPSMLIFSSTNQRSLSIKLNKLIEKPKELVTSIDHKYYLSNSTVPIINKKYCEIRSNFNSEVKQMYIGEI
jgi:hypothetical protein